jgi:hypothetical protein
MKLPAVTVYGMLKMISIKEIIAMRKINGHKVIIQDHAKLANRYYAMAQAVYIKGVVNGGMSDEERIKKRDLEEQARNHSIKASLSGDSFIMIL